MTKGFFGGSFLYFTKDSKGNDLCFLINRGYILSGPKDVQKLKIFSLFVFIVYVVSVFYLFHVCDSIRYVAGNILINGRIVIWACAAAGWCVLYPLLMRFVLRRFKRTDEKLSPIDIRKSFYRGFYDSSDRKGMYLSMIYLMIWGSLSVAIGIFSYTYRVIGIVGSLVFGFMLVKRIQAIIIDRKKTKS
jgi:hypothetical protein